MAKKPKKNNRNRPTVVAPYDRPYLTKRQQRQEAIRRATAAVEPISAIESRAARERAGAKAITESFESMLARQAAQNQAALQGIQSAADGAGSALVTGAVTGATQEQAGVPLFAAGEGVRLQRDVTQREADARKQRQQAFREFLAQSEADVRAEEKEKQAARIERAAAESAYGLDLQKEQRRQYESDRDYNLAVRNLQLKIDEASGGSVADLGGAIDDAIAGMGKTKSPTRWVGSVSFNTKDGKNVTVTLPESGVPFDPRGLSSAQKNNAWIKWLRSKGYEVENGTPIQRGNVTNFMMTQKPREIADAIFDQLVGSGGYSMQDAYRAILASDWGRVNARVVSAAYQALRG